MFDAYESNLGTRIRYYRKRAGMTQKQLAEACGITEPAIRNYELGNRIPNYDTLNDIAAALDVNYYTLADPDLSAFAGVMHCLFRLEYAHGLKPAEADGRAVLIVDPVSDGYQDSFLQQMLNQWLDARKKMDRSEWSIDQYEDWEVKYPIVLRDTGTASDIPEGSTQGNTEKTKRKRPKKS